MNLLFLGDIVGKPGRQAVRALVPKLIHREDAAFVIANCENVSAGAGVKPENARELLEAGIDVLTSGNHIWRFPETADYIAREERLLRPANFPPGAPGHGSIVRRTPSGVHVAVINLMGRVFMDSIDCPFQEARRQIEEVRKQARVIFVDMHCDATSEKGAMGWYLDGQVSAVIGSHTHVQTADERLLPKGTAFLTDAGMCGPIDSVIGVRHELAVRRFVTHMPTRFEPASGRAVVQGAVVSVDPETGRATAIKRIREFFEKS